MNTPEGAADSARTDCQVRLALLQALTETFDSEDAEKQHYKKAASVNEAAVLKTPRGRALLNPPSDPSEPEFVTPEHSAAETEHTVKLLRRQFHDDNAVVQDYLLDLLRANQPFADREAQRDFLQEARKKYGQDGEAGLREMIKNADAGLGVKPDAVPSMLRLLQNPLIAPMLTSIIDNPELAHNPVALMAPTMLGLLKDPAASMALIEDMETCAPLLDHLQYLLGAIPQ